MTEEYMTTGEVAELIGVSESCVRSWDKSGRFKPDRVTTGRHRQYLRENVKNYAKTGIKSRDGLLPDFLLTRVRVEYFLSGHLYAESKEYPYTVAFIEECKWPAGAKNNDRIWFDTEERNSINREVSIMKPHLLYPPNAFHGFGSVARDFTGVELYTTQPHGSGAKFKNLKHAGCCCTGPSSDVVSYLCSVEQIKSVYKESFFRGLRDGFQQTNIVYVLLQDGVLDVK